MSRDANLGEQALDKVAEVAIESQLDQAEKVDVNLRTDPGKVVQGKVDSISVAGEGLVMKKDLRAESVEVKTGAVAIDPVKALLGQLSLAQPTDAEAKVVLTEPDINRALASDFLQAKMKNLEMTYDNQPIAVDVQRMVIELPGDGKLVLHVQLRLHGTNEDKQFSAIVKPLLKDQGHRIDLEVVSAESKGLSLNLITAIFEHLLELLDLRNFDLDGTTIQLKDFSVQKQGELQLRGATTISKLPEM